MYVKNAIACALAAVVLLCGGGTVSAAPPNADVPYAVLTPQMTADPADLAWKTALTLPPLTLSPGAPNKSTVGSPTLVSLLWDARYLYIRFVSDDQDIYVPIHGHDSDLYRGDVVEVYVDPAGDARQFLEIAVSPDNDTMDKLHLITATLIQSDDKGMLLPDIIDRDQWSAIGYELTGLVTATHRVPVAVSGPGWIADLALPANPLLRRLGIVEYKSPLTIRANFIRYDEQKNIDSSTPYRLVAMNWAPVLWGRPHRSPQAMGYLRFLGR